MDQWFYMYFCLGKQAGRASVGAFVSQNPLVVIGFAIVRYRTTEGRKKKGLRCTKTRTQGAH